MTTSTFVNIFVSSAKKYIGMENKKEAVNVVLEQAFSGEGQFRGDAPVDVTVLVRVFEVGSNRELYSISHPVVDVFGVENAIHYAYRRVCR